MKIILVTGATSGFGWEMCKTFVERGWKVIAMGRREERLKQLQEEVKHRENLFTVPVDVRQKDQVDKVILFFLLFYLKVFNFLLVFFSFLLGLRVFFLKEIFFFFFSFVGN